MRIDRINSNVIDAPLSYFDKVIEWLLISLLAFMPLAFGAVEAWSEEVVIALAAAISLCFLLKIIVEKETRLIWSWSYVPVVLFILIAVIQLIPLQTSLVSTVSPNTAGMKKELLGDLPNSSALLNAMTLSFYPNATKHDLRLILSIAAVFLVVVNIYRRPEQIKRLLAAIAIIGGTIAALALAQDLFGNGKIYWFVPGADKAHSGTFINHSHYGQFMNLSIGAALGLIMVKVHEDFAGQKITPTFVIEYFSSPAARVIWFLVAMIIVGAATVFVSLTRGGMISMLVATAFTTLILSSRQFFRGRSWIIVLIVLGAFTCVLYVGFDAVYDRLATLQELRHYEGRWQMLKDLTVSFRRFPLLGTGLGTYNVVYPMLDSSTTTSLASHAENEYAQATGETGFIGLSALVLFGIIIWTNYVRNITSASIPIRSAAYGLGFGLLAIMFHSLSDFGQHLPANAVLSAVSCALLLSLVNTRQKSNSAGKEAQTSRGSRGLRTTLLVCASVIWAWSLPGANSARLAEASWKKALDIEYILAGKDQQASDAEYAYLISNAAKAADYEPDNIKYRHWLNVYRWRSISRFTDPNTGAVIIPEQGMEFVHRIVDELHNARLLCPTYGATYCVVGQLEKLMLNDPNGAERIRKGFQLAPCDPTACYVAGLLDAEEQQVDASFEKFSRAIKLDARLFQAAANIYINHLSRPDLAVALAGDNTGWLSQVANALADMQEHKDIVVKARTRVVELLKQSCSGPEASASALASLANIYRREQDNEAAIEHYRRALALDYGQVQWRYTLARLLAENDRIPEAIHEARICLRLRPQFKTAERLIADLSVLPGAMNEENPTP